MPNHKILNIPASNIPLQNYLTKELGISKIVAQVLINRGLESIDEAGRFLNPNPSQFLDPYSFSDMDKAVSLVRKACEKKEGVMVFGDYDADGLTALTLLKEALKRIGLEAAHYIPHRIREGYGLTKNILQLAKQKNIKLLITVDCGISSYEEIEELSRNDIKTIITDHHEPSSQRLPPAHSILNPKIKDSGYKYRDLAGVGVAYKLAQALCGTKRLEDLDLVTLGTIADSAPLIGENRVIVKEGLPRLSQTKRLGIRALIDNAGIKNKKFTSTYVSFILGPRINASGRLDSAEASLKLLMSQTQEEASELARILEAHNRERQRVEGKILEEAADLIAKEINFKEHKVIVLAKEGWHQGVLGIVASKLADRFYRPAIIISLSGALCKGSARSIKNFHLFDALVECREFLSSFGGHAHAAGIVIDKDNIEDFKNTLNRIAENKMSVEHLLPSLDIDMQLGLADIDERMVLELERLEPFGEGNPQPLFYTKDLALKGEPCVLSRDTLKFWVSDGKNTYQAIGFGMGCFKDSLKSSDGFDLVYSPKIDSWQGDESVLLEAKDIIFR